MSISKLIYFLLLTSQLITCWSGIDDSTEVALFMRRKLDLLSDRMIRQVSSHVVAPDVSQYDFTLRQLTLHLNSTITDPNILFARARSNGDTYLLIGKQISRVIITEDNFNLAPIATVIDVNEKVTEFEIEELLATENKGFLVVALYLRDRFQIYQISSNPKGLATAKSIQRIGRSGRSTRSFLVQSMSNLFLITGYLESGSGKIAVYRWLNMHFSLRDVKEMSRCDDLLVFSGTNQLVLLVLGLAEYPQRSVNNIFMLNSQFKLIKTQEMFFYFDRMPHYEIEDQFYILRCLALGKCFLYKWNGESLFRRVSKVSFDPRSIDLMASDHNIAVISLERTLYFYNNQPLLKMASSYVVIDARGAAVDTSLMIAPQVSNVLLHKDRNTEKLYLYLLYSKGPKLIDIFEVRLSKGRSSPSPGEQSNFNALKTCLMRIKDMVNIRKNWIDLIKYQLGKTIRTCKSTGQVTLASKVFVADSNTIESIVVEGNIDNSPQELVSEWNAIKDSLAVSHSQSKDLFYLNRMNTMQSNLKIRGNLHTKSTKMNSVKVHANQGRNMRTRSKRDIQSSRTVTSVIVNAREIVFNGKIFENTLSRNNINYIISPVHVTNIYTPTVLMRLNTINRIPILHMLFNTTEKIMEKGHKVFKAIDTKVLKVFLLDGVKAMQRFSSLRSFVDRTGVGEPIQLSDTRGVANLVINGRLNNVPVVELLQQLYYADKKSTINGNVFLRAPLYIRNVYARSLNSFPTNNYFDLRTNQTISAVVHLSQVYATTLHSKTINGINIPGDITLISSTEMIKAALASNFVVLEDLTLSTEDQHFTKHVLGTKVEDFSQIYTGRVHLKGSLKLNKLQLENQKGQLLLRGLTASPETRKHFWMKHFEQEIGSFTFNRQVEVNHLVCGELNYNPTVSYLRGDNWPSHLSLEMSKAYVRGFVKTYVTTPTFLQYIHSEAVQRGSMSTVSGRKVFTGHLHTDTFVADVVDSISIQSLATDTSTLAFLDGAKQIERLSAEECYIELLGRLTLKDFHDAPFADIVENSVNVHNPQKLEYLILPDIKVEHLQAALINGVNAEDFITEIDDFTYRVDPFATQFKIDNLVVRKNIISTSQIFMEYLNTVNVKEYLKLLTLKDNHNVKQWEIGGCKSLQKGLTVDGKLNVVLINRLIMDSLLYNSARKSMRQNVVGSWYIGHLVAKYVATKQINDIPTKYLQNSNLKTFNIKHDISVETLLVSSNVHGIIFPNSSSATMAPNIQSVASLAVQGSFLLQQWKPGTFFFDIILSAVTGQTDVFDKTIVFHGNFIDMLNIWNEGKIFSRSCNFIHLLLDSVKRIQKNLVFSSVGKSFLDIVCSGSVASNDLITASLVNGIDVIHLNRSIHPVGHQQEMIKSTKYFEEEVKVVQLLCNDELTGNLYPHHLDLHSETSQMPRKRYHFEKPTVVIGNLYVDAINDYSLQHFLATRVVKNQTFAHEYREKSQQVTGYVTFSNLVLSNKQNTVHVINGIPVNEIVSRSSNEHQVMVEPKRLKGTIQLLGPTSIMTCNDFNLLDAYKSSFMLHAAELFFKKLIFTAEGTLQNGLSIEYTLNGISVQKMMKLRLSSVEDLLPLIPVIREQLSVSSDAYVANSATESHMLYIENVPLDDGIIMVQSTASRQYSEKSDASRTINLDNTCINGVNRINVTVHQKSSRGDQFFANTLIDGVLIRSEWKELPYIEENEILIVSLVEIKGKSVLVILVHKNKELSVLQELPLNTFGAEFYLVSANDTSLLLAVSDSLQLQLHTLIPKLKLYYYDPIAMRFINFKTFSGSYNAVVAVNVEEMIMIAISEKSSNILDIFAMDHSYSTLYQKIIFDSTVASLRAFRLQGFPALQISTVDNLIYIYVHNSLEGWKQLSYGRLAADIN
ncbi:uncharacterized protein LOC135713118 isoform X2 [Ochlerotatus camptorhynchus]|uniref:uncharacterized protein LOC135713118 isoform X2 n=1 Tax=Ochlerotatus camptorhynchus TaxID=644619 RepID=UPI0031DACCD8